MKSESALMAGLRSFWLCGLLAAGCRTGTATVGLEQATSPVPIATAIHIETVSPTGEQATATPAPAEASTSKGLTETLTVDANRPTMTPATEWTPVSPTRSLPTARPTTLPTISAGDLSTSQLSGRFVVADSLGIRQTRLPELEWEDLLKSQYDWIDWGASFSDDRSHVAYWIRYYDRFEVWVTDVADWQPKRVLLVKEDHDIGGATWVEGDRYILSQQMIIDDSGPLDELKTVRTYVVDLASETLVTDDYWPGACSILAPSPKTGQIALWCKQAEQTTPARYLILEPKTTAWVTDEEPNALIDNCVTFFVCAWSPNGEYVAYIVQAQFPEGLYYTPVEHPAPSQLEDEVSDFIAFPHWSPDSENLFYDGGCHDFGLSCPTVMSVDSNTVLWRKRGTGVEGSGPSIYFWDSLWSPDGTMLAFPGFDPSLDEELFVVYDIMSGEEAERLPLGRRALVLDAVWLKEHN